MANSRRNKGKDASFRLKESPNEEKTIRLDYSYGNVLDILLVIL